MLVQFNTQEHPHSACISVSITLFIANITIFVVLDQTFETQAVLQFWDEA